MREEAPGEEDPELDGPEASRFRAVAATANYLGIDRADLQFAGKEACRDMSRPRASSLSKLKRIGRYLLEYPRAIWRFKASVKGVGVPSVIDAYSDSDWAGCRVSRRSTGGGLLVVGDVVVKSWSSAQATVAT